MKQTSPMLIRKFLPLAGLSILFLLVSCEKEQKGTVDPDLITPYLSSVFVAPPSVNIDLDSGVVRDAEGLYHFTVRFTATAHGNGGPPPSTARVEVFKPRERSPFAIETVRATGGGPDSSILSGDIAVAVLRSDVGQLRFAATLPGGEGTVALRSVLITRRNSRPRIERLSVPDSATIGELPAPDSTIFITATVSDSDGIADVNTVRFLSVKPDSTFGNDGNPIELFDDASQNIVLPPEGRSGDILQGDGVYSRKVILVSFSINRLPPHDTVTTQRGTYRFIFSALDNSGAESDTLSRSIKVK